jgi:hypothetical protein
LSGPTGAVTHEASINPAATAFSRSILLTKRITAPARTILAAQANATGMAKSSNRSDNGGLITSRARRNNPPMAARPVEKEKYSD